MDRSNRVPAKFVAWIACILGGFGSFMQWLGIKPADLAMSHQAAVPHALWLVLAILLFGVGIGSSIWSGIVQRGEINRLRSAPPLNVGNDEQIQRLKNDLTESANRNLEYRTQLAENQEQSRRLEVSNNADIFRWREAARQCEEEKRTAIQRTQELEELLTPLSPLRMEALKFRRRLQRFIEETGPEPVCDTPQYENDLEKYMAAKIAAGYSLDTKTRAFRNLLDSTYQVQLHADAAMLYHKFVVAGIVDQHFGSLLDEPQTVERLKELDSLLWEKIGLLQ